MGYSSLEAAILDLEKNNHLIRVTEEVDPDLEMAAIHLRVHEAGGPALLFENVKGSSYRACSNLFGTLDRSRFIFRDTFSEIKNIIQLRNNPMQAFKHPLKNISAARLAWHALPLRNPIQKPVLFQEIQLQDLPQIRHWPKDGGAFITLPQVYTEDIEHPGILRANLGMYRIQFSGNNYIPNQEAGLHYQLHRGIGVHQSKTNARHQPLKVSIFVGGPPAHTVAAVMPLPEGISELTFAGLLNARRFRYCYRDGFCVSTDADFVITGEVFPQEVKPEGPFGDHLGYYSLTHDFPLLRIRKIYARKNAIWPFTVVGRPPQEDTAFGELIHELTGDAIPNEIPGVQEVHAVDAAGVHPLLLAIGSERYTPYAQTQQPAELLTQANHILGTGQLSLAKFLFITADPLNGISTHRIPEYIQFMLERIHLDRDIHFYTHATMDTLDYSGGKLNQGSKVVFAAYGQPIRTLSTATPNCLQTWQPHVVMPGIIALTFPRYQNHDVARREFNEFQSALQEARHELQGYPFILVSDDAKFLTDKLNNFLWVTFTRCNPAQDLYGLNDRYVDKHWECDNLIFDVRSKPHHAPVLELDPKVERNIDRLFSSSGSLAKIKR
jgi:4-hydroxy-3-polyprenylbenzoate decarboxylase